MAFSNCNSIFSIIAACALGTAGIGCNKDTVRNDASASTQARSSAKTNAESSASSARTPSIDDSAITAAVSKQFMRDPGIDQAHLTVRTTDGVVQLTGTAGDLLSKERAVRLAENVRGVRTVSDRIVLQVKTRADGDIQKDVQTALQYNATTDAMNIESSVSNGSVTLKGRVHSAVEKDIAERVAKRVEGVRDVESKLQIDYLAKRTDAEIQRDIESRLHWDAMVGGDLAVHVNDGHVRLTGETGSAAERTRAYSDARVTGVESVDISAVEIKPELARRKSRQSAYVAISDADVVNAIKAATFYDPRVKSFNVRPDVTLGVVTLRGEVDNLQAKLAAESLARHTVGVMDVKNEIKVVPGAKLTDSQKAQRIDAALRIDPLTDTYDLHATVQEGKATLTGTVNTVFESAEAADVAGSIEGVTSVDNRLIVKKPGGAYIFSAYVDPYGPFVENGHYLPATAVRPDSEISKDIENELFWSPFVDSDEVHVSVQRGEATLTGSVDSWAERNAASEDALEGGAIAVFNRLKVE